MKVDIISNTYKIKEKILLLKFCPYVTNNNYLIVVTSTKLVLLEVIDEESIDGNFNITYKSIKDIIFQGVIDLSWSPLTNFLIAPRCIKLSIASSENCVYYLSSDLKDSTEQLLIGKHKSFVNSVICNPENSEQVVSAGDDCVVNVWSVGSGLVKKTGSIMLETPGMVISFHPQEKDKMMVAEKSGVIRFFNIVTLRAFMSIDCCRNPLSSANWSLSNPRFVVAIAGTELLLFNTSQSSQFLKSRGMHSDVGGVTRWCYTNDNFVVTLGKSKSILNILNVRNLEKCQVVQTFEIESCNSFEFHHRLPIVFLAVNNEIQIKMIDSKLK